VPGRDHDSVLFDLDGVLVDSRAAITGCINHALVEHELPARPAEDLHRFIGPSLATGFASLTGHSEGSPMVASCIESYRARYVDASLQETTVAPGVDLALAELAGRCSLAVATSKPLRFAEPLLTALHLRHFFEAVAGPDLSVRGESKASTIAAALKMLGPPDRAVMVGDRSHDVIGARANSLPSIGVTWGIGSAKELRDAGAESIVEVPAELAGSVKRLLGDAPNCSAKHGGPTA
jgi:phosphoglycolate phosphatase